MNKLNWPTAFVIVSIILAGAFVYNKPTGAAFGSSGDIVKEITTSSSGRLWHMRSGKLRLCSIKNTKRLKVNCGDWAG